MEAQFPMPRNTAASKIGNSVISLLWQLRCRCNLDHNKFSSLSNTTVVAIFPKLRFWRRSLCSNLGGIDPEKLYRATLSHWDHFLERHCENFPLFFIHQLKHKNCMTCLYNKILGIQCHSHQLRKKKCFSCRLSSRKREEMKLSCTE